MNTNIFLDTLLCLSAEKAKKALIYERALGKLDEKEFKKKMVVFDTNFEDAIETITLRDFDPPAGALEQME